MADKAVPPSTGQHDLKAYYVDLGDGTHGLVIVGRNYVWDSVLGEWVKMTQPGAGGSGPDPVGLKNIAEDAINPATQDTLATLLTEAVFTGRIGEVQVNPTQYTLLERLKVLATLLAGGLPVALTGSGNLKMALLEALPAGTNNIGDVDVVSAVLPTPPTSVGQGVTTVAAAATRVQLNNIACKSISIRAHSTNTGLIYVGNSSVAAANGRRLSPGESYDAAIDNANRFYVDAATNGDGVSYGTVS